MKLQKVICLGFNGKELEEKYWQELDEQVESRILLSSEEEINNQTEADGLFVKLGAKVGRELIDKLPNLKYIGMLGTGYGGIDTNYAASKGVTVTNIADYATEAVAEFTFGILLEYLRSISKARTQAKAEDYTDNFNGSEIKGKKIGVIGLGDIGKRTAQLAQAFSAEVVYWSRNRKPEFEAAGVTYCELDELLASSDIVTLNLALNNETEGIINAERINKLKSGAIFINPSPMELIDFAALCNRLVKKDMVFMLDHSDEMTSQQLNTLQPLNNAIIYPAIAYLTEEAGQLKKRIYVDNLKNFLNGRPTNKVN